MKGSNFYFRILNYVPIVIVIFFVLILAIAAVFLWPKYQKLNEIQSSIGQKELELQNSEEYFSSLTESEEKLKEYSAELSKIDSALPNDSSLPSLFYFIQQASSESGLVLVGLSPFITSLSEERPNVKEHTFSVNLIGAYESFKVFLSTLESSARMIEIRGFSFSALQDETSFDFELGLKTFSY